MKPVQLYKSTITIWSAENPNDWKPAELIQEATKEEAACHCSGIVVEVVTNSLHYPDVAMFDLPDPKPVFPKPWKIRFHPTNGPTVYAANEIAVPWEEVENILNQEEEGEKEYWEGKDYSEAFKYSKAYEKRIAVDRYGLPPYWK